MTMEDQKVRSVVKRPPVVVHPESTLRAVAVTLAEESIGAVVVRGTRPAGAPGVPRGWCRSATSSRHSPMVGIPTRRERKTS
jgi:hypothetical protein